MGRPHVELISEAEFLALPGSMGPVELLDGEVIVPPVPTLAHQVALERLVRRLKAWAHGRSPPVTVGQPPLAVRFGPGRILSPDAFVVLTGIPESHAGPIRQVPELCAEVVSGDRAYNRVTKRLAYAKTGVSEYWLIDPRDGGQFERFTGPGLGTHEVISGAVSSRRLPGLVLDLSGLFADWESTSA